MTRSMQLSMVLCLCCVAGFGTGCADQNKQSQVCQAIIPQERLPDGWRLVPNSMLPPSDKMPWWKTNPLLLEGSETKQLEVAGKPISASKLWAAMYVKKITQIVVIYCMAYPTQEAASAEYSLFSKGYSPEKGLLGILRKQENTIVLFIISSDCPDRSFFVDHFNAVAYHK